MVRIAIFFLAGILLGIHRPDILNTEIVVLVLAVVIAAYFLAFRFLHERRTRRLFCGLTGLAAIFILGYIHLDYTTSSRSANHLLTVSERIQYYEAIVRSAPESKSKTWRVEVEVKKVKTNEWHDKQGIVLLYVSKKSVAKIHWNYGDRLLIKGSPVEIKPPANPNEFDFKRFLSFKNIYHQQFVQSNQIQKVGESKVKGVIYYSLQAREWASSILEKFVEGEQERAIVSALVLGVTEGIDTDLQNAYAASGAMHVLAVSGLHVGIIYAILLLLLRPLKRYAWNRWIVFVISILCLWTFAFVTGLSPSVLRAVCMFSFIAIARPLGWHTNIYNTLAGSAFILLVYNPYLIMSVGFQLSYLAVWGIVYLQRPIYSLLEIDNHVVDWIWQITTVSIAAQISTFALSLLYFHQFPVYFMISNLFVIPLSAAILTFAILLLLVSTWVWVASLISMALIVLTKALNWIVFSVEDLPFSLIENIYLTTFQCWLIMIALLSLIFLTEFKSIRWLYLAMACSLFFITTQWIHFSESTNRQQFVVYSINGYSAMEWIDHGISYFFADSALMLDSEKVRFHIQPNRLNGGVTIVQDYVPFQIELERGVHVIRWNGSSMAFIQRKNYTLPELAEIDYLVVGKNAINASHLPDHLNVKNVILDGSNSLWYVEQWRTIARKQNIAFHAVVSEGAFILTK